MSLDQKNRKKTLKPAMTSGHFEGDFIYHHHIEPRVQFYVPKREPFLLTLKYIDQRLLERCGLNFIRIVDRFHEVHDNELVILAFWSWGRVNHG